VVLLTGALHDLEIHEYAATEVKSRITGHGRADKDQVAKMLRILLGGQEFETADASDALALALAHALVGKPKAGKKSGNSLKALAEAAVSRGRALKR
jgi:crossover junction endodeoxyribonuclease RuvC